MTTVLAVVATFLGTVLVVFPAAWLLAVSKTARAEISKVARGSGLGDLENVKLYGRAVKILRRLDGLTELDGELAADMLSPESKRLVSDWVSDYRRVVEAGRAAGAGK
jgi:hypothetical protein